jgi:tricorn protease-like protein/C-terminal processing protease CtpA/Prc
LSSEARKIGFTIYIDRMSISLLASIVAFGQDPAHAGLLGWPDFSKSKIAFAHAGGIWSAPRAGGAATPLVQAAGGANRPRFSSDGQMLAFEADFGDGHDLWTMPAHGGIPTRLTDHPTRETLCGWTPKGDVLFFARGIKGHPKGSQLFTVSPEGGPMQQFPVPYGTWADINNSGQLIYTPWTRDHRSWKRYRGGMATDLWLSDGETASRLTTFSGTDTAPMWHNGAVHFLSDNTDNHRLGLFRLEEDKQTLRYASDLYDLREPSAGPGGIIFREGSKLKILNDNDDIETIEITLTGARPALAARRIDATPYLVQVRPGPTGREVVAEAYGDLFTVPLGDGVPQNLTNTSHAAERSGAWSPNGAWIAHASDQSGEYELELIRPDGSEIRRLSQGSFGWWTGLWWHPESTHLAAANHMGELILFDIENGTSTLLATDAQANTPELAFSPNGQHLAWSCFQPNRLRRAIAFHDLDTGVTQPLTSGDRDEHAPCFVDGGWQLAFVASHAFAPVYAGGTSDSTWIYPDREVLMLTTLTSDHSPLTAPQIDRESWEAEAGELDPTGIWEGTLTGLLGAGLSEDEGPLELQLWRDENGTLTGTMRNPMQAVALPQVEFDPTTGQMRTSYAFRDIEIVVEGQLVEGQLSGDWEVTGMGIGGQWSTIAEEQSEPASERHPAAGVWNLTLQGLSAMGFATDEAPVALEVIADGSILGASFMAMGRNAKVEDLRYEDGILEGTVMATGMEILLEANLFGNEAEGTWIIPEVAEGEFFGSRPPQSEDDAAPSEAMTVDASEGASDEMKVDLEGALRRARFLNVPAGNISMLVEAGDHIHLVWSTAVDPEQPPLHVAIDPYDMNAEANFYGPAFLLDPLADGSGVLRTTLEGWDLFDAMSMQAEPVLVEGLFLDLEPREAWRQMVIDAWRLFRDTFYVKNMHAVDWDAALDEALIMLEDCGDREDVARVIREMIAELNVGHAYYLPGGWSMFDGGGQEPAPDAVGFMGVDWIYENEHWTVESVVQPESGFRAQHHPLEDAEASVQVGDRLLAVDGRPLSADRSPWAALVGTVGLGIEATFERNGTTFDILVTPIDSEAELRHDAWIDANRRKVHEATDGRVGYIYVRDTGVEGQTDLVSQFFAEMHREALIIDERWNGGGQIPTRFIELLNRQPVSWWARRHGDDWRSPSDGHFGPKCMLINGLAGSGGDMFPWLFRRSDLGPLIGTRTWGGLVGITGGPALLDGAAVAVPTFGIYEADGTWAVEGHGVAPDIEVIDDPVALWNGQDLQLEAGINAMLEALRTNPPQNPPRPTAPDRSGSGAAPEDQ